MIKCEKKMWKPGNLVRIKQRIPINGQFLDFAVTCRVVRNHNHLHRCINCPFQQKYCDINKCEQMLPFTCTLVKAQKDSEQCES